VNPRPPATEIDAIYKDLEYFAGTHEESNVGYADYTDQRRLRDLQLTAARRRAIVRQHVQLNGKRVLEIGCATGEFAASISEVGCEVIGIDVCRPAIDIARNRYNAVDFRVADIDTLNSTERFDVVIAWEVLERLVSPKAWLSRVAARLRMSGAVVVISTPNYRCAETVGIERWSGFNSSFEHLYFFSPESLATLGSAAALRLDRVYSGGGSGLHRAPNQDGLQPSIARWLRNLPPFEPLFRIRRRILEYRARYTGDLTRHNLVAFFSRAQ
jgi:2-polyprenyl-3-methyl-5-hydroxy-6-metoxy-1,4-benzoquinol methylase